MVSKEKNKSTNEKKTPQKIANKTGPHQKLLAERTMDE
jgi:hypothetical protein